MNLECINIFAYLLITALEELYQNPATPEFVSRIAREALLKLVDEDAKAALKAQIIASLTPELQSLAPFTSVELLEEFAINHPYHFFSALDKLYQLDNEHVRPTLLNILRTAPFQPNYFRAIRHIFKIAEYRRDADVFAILAYRFEREPGNFSNDLLPYSHEEELVKFQLDKKRVYTEELQQDEPILAYSNQTQHYFRRRVWRTLKQLGEAGDAEYIKMAVAVLLEYDDSQEPPVRRSQYRKWDDFQRNVRSDWDKYADYLAFNHILYSNSPRYFYNDKSWYRRKDNLLKDVESEVREEAFAQLWENHPEELLRLLQSSKCGLVHHFAVKALRACRSFCIQIEIDTIIQLLNTPYEVTTAFAFELAINYHSNTNEKLITALNYRLFSPFQTKASFWKIEEEHIFFLENLNLIASLVTSQDNKTRHFALKLVNSYNLHKSTHQALTQKIVFKLLALTPSQSEVARDIAHLLAVNFREYLLALEHDTWLKLLSHPIPVIQELGALLFLYDANREITSKLLPSVYDLIHILSIERISKKLDDKTLLIAKELILRLVTHPVVEYRHIVKTIIARIAVKQPDFALQLAFKLLKIFFSKDDKISISIEDFYSKINKNCHILRYSQIYRDIELFIVSLLQTELKGWENSATLEIVLKLVLAKSLAAQKLGCSIFNSNIIAYAKKLSFSDIIALNKHENQSIRQVSRQILLSKIKSRDFEKLQIIILVELLESHFTDVRKIAFQIFTTELSIEDFTPNLIIEIIDNENKHIQNLGKNLLNRYFQHIESNNLLNEEITLEFTQSLLKREKHQGSYSYVIRKLQDKFPNWRMESVSKITLIKLLRSETSSVQEFAGLILQKNYQRFLTELTASEIVQLANNDIFLVRQTAQQLFSQILKRLRYDTQEMLDAVRILESKWQDTREFAFQIFTTEFKAEEFSASVLIRICDSTSSEVRKFGRELLSRNSQTADISYMLKFSEHPAADMQLFVTNYLETYAANNPQVLRELTPYFSTVLSNINRNRATKKRILQFLSASALRNEESATIIAEIIAKYSGTMAVVDKEFSIQIMLKIKQKYPQITLPIQVKEVVQSRRKSAKNGKENINSSTKYSK